jgi:hypothetical protein
MPSLESAGLYCAIQEVRQVCLPGSILVQYCSTLLELLEQDGYSIALRCDEAIGAVDPASG